MVLVALKVQMSNQELAKKFDIHPQQLNTWKREFLNGAEDVFTKGKGKLQSQRKSKKRTGYKNGYLAKVEIDF